MTTSPAEMNGVSNQERAGRRTRGSISAMFAVLAVFFFLIIGVVAEGGRKLANLSRAEDLAAEAARAAAATLESDVLVGGGPSLNPEDPRVREQAIAVVDSLPGAQLEDLEITAESVRVVVRISQQSFIPGMNIDGVGSHRALALDPAGS